MPSTTLEDYLETIYKLARKGPVRPTPIAEILGVSGPTVTATLKRLQTRGLVTRDNGDVVLTEDGQAAAIDIVRKHRISERFLVDVLGLSWDEAHEDACKLEHALSPRVLSALELYLDNPAVCPHGHPIPAKDGTITEVEGVPLCDFESGRCARIVQVEEDDEAMLSYLGSLGMFLETEVCVTEVTSPEGLLIVEVNGSTYELCREVTEKILVCSAKK